MYIEIEAKGLLSHGKKPDPFFGIKYNMNLYRGCEHQCIYCDSRSECYGIENFTDVLVKINAIDLLQKELASKRVKGTVGTGSMNDPYTPAEKVYNLTGRALEVIAEHRFPVHIITKSDLVLKDRQTLLEIQRVYAAVSFTITTCDDDLAAKLEPGAPPPSARFKAMAALAAAGIYTGVTMMPILPFISDAESNITGIVKEAHHAGAKYILPWFAVTLRDRQRSYYYAKLDQFFPGLRQRYQSLFREKYECMANNAHRLSEIFFDHCAAYGIKTKINQYTPEEKAEQLSLF